MTLRVPVLRFLTFTTLLIVLALGEPASARPFAPRVPPDKPKITLLHAGEDPTRVLVKFREGTEVRLQAGRLYGRGRFDAEQLDAALSRHGASQRQLHRLFSRSEQDLDRERVEGQARSGRQLADLNLYYELEVPRGADAAALCDALNALPSVELAEPAPLPAPPPVDLSPPTPSFVGSQGYRSAAPYGIGIDDIATVPGADGAGLRVVDIEYAWVLDHEDLELDAGAVIDPEPAHDPFPDEQGSHGTAVLGELVGIANAYGVTGLAPAAVAFVSPAMTQRYGYNLPRAINLAASAVSAGDVILLEQQTPVCGGPCDQTQNGCGPVEWYQATFDAIQSATARGIVVVEAAGNGNVNLDAPACQGRFDRSLRDSGAIVVGAGAPGTRSRLGFSSYGARVDVQGWGHSVTTAGYGSAFDPGDVRQRYTHSFSGTSSASPIVAGAVLAIQGAVTAQGLPPLDPLVLRDVLRETGTPQPASDTSGAIGPLPDTARVIAYCASADPVLELSIAPDFALVALEPVTLEASLRSCREALRGGQIEVETPEGRLVARDDGAAPDAVADDGRHTVVWTPRLTGPVTLIATASGFTASVSGRVLNVPVYEITGRSLQWVDATRGARLPIAFDDDSVEIPIGFRFGLYGEAYEFVRVSSNGYLTFGSSGNAYSNAPIPSSAEPNALIAPYWDDLNPARGGAVYSLLEGAAPSRRFTIEWNSVPYFGEESARATFQVTLFERGGMRFQYLDVSSGSWANGASATAGIESADGSRGLGLSFDQPLLVSGSAFQISAAPACRDGRDNDGDGLIDHPSDAGCASPGDGTETPTPPSCGFSGLELVPLMALWGASRRWSRGRCWR